MLEDVNRILINQPLCKLTVELFVIIGILPSAAFSSFLPAAGRDDWLEMRFVLLQVESRILHVVLVFLSVDVLVDGLQTRRHLVSSERASDSFSILGLFQVWIFF